MKQTAKEKLNNKARKMIDLIYDEVEEGGEKEIESSFFDDRHQKKCKLTVKIAVVDPDTPVAYNTQIQEFIGNDDEL